ncbi:hypothetical protein CONPUDRAFT_163637 [Coniophora puteana RWD-64-598 SS2]|uniref:Uncharacterized protein n=1 Tax=Coniophora puteana (strain RWD-64-598) TaxID=741705 RepID=A0A5M3MZH0_CONPW|nr:uncharacterized protein CONPUDRAFT_163637 [Coniophora puteana RWD-64-598 SS2]EIW84538.1 hypothetical protein CONPUDRAFT_163637 [Coniophora puteana RWD-64-598 SS2]
MDHSYPPSPTAEYQAVRPRPDLSPVTSETLTTFNWSKEDVPTPVDENFDGRSMQPILRHGQRPPPKVDTQYRWWYISEYHLCFALHGFLVVMHIAFLAAGSVGAIDRVVVESKNYSFYAAILAIVPQAVAAAKMISAALVYYTQRLATRRAFKRSQTLTALHDQMSAWIGLGSAAMALFDQYTLPASVVGTCSIMLYLGLITVIHITTPTLITLEPTELPITSLINTTLGTPNLTSFIPWTEPGTDNPDQLIEIMSPLMSVLGPSGDGTHSDLLVTTGLANGTLYDVVEPNNASQPIRVNATTFDVSCGYLSDFQIQWKPATNTEFSYQTSRMPSFNISNGLLSWTDLTIADLAPSSLRVMTQSSRGVTLNLTRLVKPSPYNIFVSTVNFTDSSGSAGHIISLPGGMNPNADNWQRIWTLQMIGCTLDISHSFMEVDPTTRTLAEPNYAALRNSSKWEAWIPPPTVKPPSRIDQAMLDLWPYAFQAAAPSSYVAGLITMDPAQIAATIPSNVAVLNVIEKYLALTLDLFPVTNSKRYVIPEDYPPPPPLTLHHLENALSSATAASFYAALHSQPTALDNTRMLPDNSAIINATMSGTSEMLYMVSASRLSFNMINIAVGLAASTILLALAISLVRDLDGPEPLVCGAGILQTMWLAHGDPEFLDRVSRVGEPTTEELRKAGMEVVRLGKIRNQEDRC